MNHFYRIFPRRTGLLVLTMATALILFAGANRLIPPQGVLKARKGNLNFRSLAFSQRGKILLRGEWVFFRNHFYFPEDFLHPENLTDRQFVEFTRNWARVPLRNGSETEDPRQGFATYRLIITGLAPRVLYGLMIPEINSTFTLWVNGERKLSAGLPGTNPAQSFPEGGPKYTTFEAENGKVELILHISNYTNARGGPVHDILFGREPEVFLSDALKIVLIYLHVVVCLIFALLLMMNLWRYGTGKWRWDGMILLLPLLALRHMLSETGLLYRLNPSMSHDLFIRLRYITTYLFGPLLLAFQLLNNSSQGQKKQPLSLVLLAAALPLQAGLLLLPTFTYTAGAWIFDLHQLAVFVAALLIRRSTKSDRLPSLFFLILFIQMRMTMLGILPVGGLSLFAVWEMLSIERWNIQNVSNLLLFFSVLGYSLILFLYTSAQTDNLIRIKLSQNTRPQNSVRLSELYGFTDREWEIIELVTQGLGNEEIADRCCISTGTVKVHMNHIYGKIGSSSRTSLVRLILYGEKRTVSKTAR